MANTFNDKRYAASEFTLDSGTEMARIHRAINLIKPYRPGKILDAGCTNGIVSAILKRETGGHVIGVDALAATIEMTKVVCDEN